MVISMLKIRRPSGRLIFNMGIAISGKTVFLIETAPRSYATVTHRHVVAPNILNPLIPEKYWHHEGAIFWEVYSETRYLGSYFTFTVDRLVQDIAAILYVQGWYQSGVITFLY